MRKIYHKYFYVPEQGKGVVGEKVFLSRLVLSITCMLICMLAMGYNAYAFFTTNIESSANVLQAAVFDVEITSQPEVSNPVAEGYSLSAGTYEVKIKVKSSSNASTGYCKIDVNGTVFYTQQFGKVAGSQTPVTERTVVITVDRDTVVYVTPCWGTYAGAETNTTTFLADEYIISVKDKKITREDRNSLTDILVVPNKAETQTPSSQETGNQPDSNENTTNTDTEKENVSNESTNDVSTGTGSGSEGEE